MKPVREKEYSPDSQQSRFRYVVIEELAPHERLDKMPEMEIDGRNVAFLASTIDETSSFQASHAGDYIQAKFFQGSKFEITLLARLYETDQKANKYAQNFVSKGVFIAGKLDAETRVVASQFLRQSLTLAADEAHDTAKDRSLFVDSGAFAYIADSHDQFLRIILVTMLAGAYLKTLEKSISELSRAARDPGSIGNSIALYDDMLKFNAGFYQRFPVKAARHELSKVWDAIAQHFRIDDLRMELDGQLSALAQWLREERDQQANIERRQQTARDNAAREAINKKEKARDKRFNRFAVTVSILLAFLALPENIQNNFWEWGQSLWSLAEGWLARWL